MRAKVYLNNGNIISLDEFETRRLIKEVERTEVTSSFLALQIFNEAGKVTYTIPLISVSYIQYLAIP